VTFVSKAFLSVRNPHTIFDFLAFKMAWPILTNSPVRMPYFFKFSEKTNLPHKRALVIKEVPLPKYSSARHHFHIKCLRPFTFLKCQIYCYVMFRHRISASKYTVPKAAHISKKYLGVHMGASPLAGKFPKAV
jgi:hypothetical protein